MNVNNIVAEKLWHKQILLFSNDSFVERIMHHTICLLKKYMHLFFNCSSEYSQVQCFKNTLSMHTVYSAMKLWINLYQNRDVLDHDCGISSANALEILQSSTKTSKWLLPSIIFCLMACTRFHLTPLSCGYVCSFVSDHWAVHVCPIMLSGYCG